MNYPEKNKKKPSLSKITPFEKITFPILFTDFLSKPKLNTFMLQLLQHLRRDVTMKAL